MKTALVLAFVLSAAVSATASADQGTPVCQPPTTLVVCEVPAVDNFNAGAVTGASKADALRQLPAYYLLQVVKRNLTVTCTTLAQ